MSLVGGAARRDFCEMGSFLHEAKVRFWHICDMPA